MIYYKPSVLSNFFYKILVTGYVMSLYYSHSNLTSILIIATLTLTEFSYVSGTVPSILYVLIHLIMRTAL